jgi:hypothetical protein
MPDFLSTTDNNDVDDPKLLFIWGVPSYNGHLAVAITDVIAGNKMLNENHMISSMDLLWLNTKTI